MRIRTPLLAGAITVLGTGCGSNGPSGLGAPKDGGDGADVSTSDVSSPRSEGGGLEAGLRDGPPLTDTGIPERDADKGADVATSDAGHTSGPGPNQPSGMTAVWDTGPLVVAPGNDKSSGGPVPLNIGDFGGQGSTGTLTLASAASTDAQPTGWRVTFPAGQVNDPAFMFDVQFPVSGTGTLYMKYEQRLGATWSKADTALASGGQKLWAPKSETGATDHIFMASGSVAESGGLENAVEVGLQGAAPSTNVPDTMSTPPSSERYGTAPSGCYFNIGEWHLIEILLTADHPLGAGNGVVTIYLDGAQVVTATREVIPASQTSGWNSLDMYASRAVYSGAQPGGPYWMDIDQVYVSVR